MAWLPCQDQYQQGGDQGQQHAGHACQEKTIKTYVESISLGNTLDSKDRVKYCNPGVLKVCTCIYASCVHVEHYFVYISTTEAQIFMKGPVSDFVGCIPLPLLDSIITRNL